MGLIKYDKVFEDEATEVGVVYTDSNWILTSRELSSHNIVLTAISWLLGERSDKTDLVHLSTTMIDPADETKMYDFTAELNQLKENPATQQCKLYIGMAGLMTLAKELRLDGPTANSDYLIKRWKAFCASISLVDYVAPERCKGSVFPELCVTQRGP
ncbi:hypothetical protein PUN28_003709 [Cardiocondyla obscurior]|uniref:Uncharacterized protein n=1 Tax=Cardiocondyla obscurior TaxID=286306 RepID=A0AAW2GN15_9HYME